MTMKIKDYMDIASLFPLMGVEFITAEIGVELDNLFRLKYANKTCGNLVTEYLESDNTITEENQRIIAKSVYLLNKHKWDDLFKFAQEEIDPWLDGSSKVETTFGRVINEELGGADEFSQLNKLEGFDSTAFVDDTKAEHTTEYGRTTETTNSGKNTMVTTRTGEVGKAMDVTLSFWERFGITRTLLADASRALSLPLYELDD